MRRANTGTFTLTPTDDAVDETDETITVSGTSGSLTVNSATISLTDDDAGADGGAEADARFDLGERAGWRR